MILQIFQKLNNSLLILCFGNVLDIGAGAGRHSLVLQNKGLDVFAIDISPEAVEIMRKKGIRRAECIDVYDFKGYKFDTLLMLMHGIGITETLAGLNRFLGHAHSLIKPAGILVFDSLDVRVDSTPENLEYQEKNRLMNRYFGEIHMQLEYKGIKSEFFTWLQVDHETLISESLKTGWKCEIIHKVPSGDYLAKLTEK